MNFYKTNIRAYTNFILGRYARLTGMTNSTALPVYLFADPSSACNLRCAMCMDHGNVSRRRRPQVIMNQDIFDSLLTDVGETLFMISLYNWGEPLLNPNLPRFISKAKGFDIYVDINTNLSLSLHNTEMEELLVSGPDSIVVSLDGFSQQTYQTYRQGGDFDLAKDNIVRLATLRDRLRLSTEIIWKFLVFSFNEHELEYAEQFCATNGITFSRKEAIIDIHSRPEWLPSYRRSELHLKHGGWPFRRRSDPSLVSAGMEETCIWHYSLAAVNSDGSLSPCCAVAEQTYDFGVIVPGKASFRDNWNNQLYRSARNILSGRSVPAEGTAAPVCLNCPYPFLKDFGAGLDGTIRKNFLEHFPSSGSLLAGAFRLLDSGEEFIDFIERNYDRLSDSAFPLADQGVAALESLKPFGIPAGFGTCSICGEKVEFRLKQEGFSLRETVCPDCAGSRRSRDLAAVVLETFGGPADSSLASHVNLLGGISIFEAQASGPVHEHLKHLPGYVCAEFLDGVPSGTVSPAGVRCENLEELTFPDGSFGLVITQDVLEHVAHPAAAFREIARVLKPGGYHIFTVPLHEGRSSVTRAMQDEGRHSFILPPVYHGDPLRSSGSLVYTDFGDDLPALLSEFGFTTELLRLGVFYTSEEIPALLSDTEHARYKELRKRAEHLKLFLYNSVVFKAKRSAQSKSQNTKTNPIGHPCHQADGSASPHPLNHVLDELLEVVRHEPVSAAGLVRIGESCFRNDLTASAAGFFQAALERDPHCSDAMNNIGVLAFAAGDYKNAETLFTNTLEFAPAFREARQNLAQLYREAPQLADRHQGDAVHCPCCGGYFPGFISGGPCLRPNACCPRCGSLERHRLLWLYLQEKTGFFTQQLRVLHVAPESIFQETFKRLPNLHYISADIASPLAMVKMDITDIHFPDNTFDVILCSHVLEHIPDDRLAIRELFRVLKPGGWAILQVPIDMKRETTYEDPSITTAEGRKKHFGQEDHVRWYGNDFTQRLREGGFETEESNFSRQFDANTIAKYGLIHDSIFIGKKLSHQ